MNRRTVLATAGGVFFVAGCLESGGEPAETQTDDAQTGSATESTVPESLIPNETSPSTLNDTFSPTTNETSSPPETDDQPTVRDLADQIETAEPTLPDPEITSLTTSRPRLVTTDHTIVNGSDEFSVTIQNTGDDGDVSIRLVWDEDRSENVPVTPVAERTTFFSSEERRTESFYAKMPAGVDGYRFTVRAATRGAYVRNNGPSGNVTVRLWSVEYEWSVDSQTVFIGSDQTELIEFNGMYRLLGDEWEITVEPATD